MLNILKTLEDKIKGLSALVILISISWIMIAGFGDFTVFIWNNLNGIVWITGITTIINMVSPAIRFVVSIVQWFIK